MIEEKISVKEILKELKKQDIPFEYYGDEQLFIHDFCPLKNLKADCVTWIKDMEQYDVSSAAVDTKRLLIVTNKLPANGLEDKYNLIINEYPKAVYFTILKIFFKDKDPARIAEDSIVETKSIGKNVSIGHHCYICEGCSIGDNTVIKNHVIIEAPTQIGCDCVIGSGTVIGSGGYGYYVFQNREEKVPDFGGVRIGNHVEIGTNCAIARGTLSNTVIEDGCKIDSLVHIAHNVCIHGNVMIAGPAILCGSVTIGENTYIAPGVTVINQTNIGKNSVIGIGSVVMQDVEENVSVLGNPARRLPECGADVIKKLTGRIVEN